MKLNSDRVAVHGIFRGLILRRVALLSFFACVAQLGHAANNDELIGGHDAIRLNPDFSPNIKLNFSSETALNLPGLANFTVPVTIQNQLGAALSQAVSASNRPSVLTPYAGQLSSDPNQPVFDSLGSLVTNKATTIGKGNFGIGVSYQHSRFTQFNGSNIGKVAEFNQKLPPNFATVTFVNDPIFGNQTTSVVANSEENLDVTRVSFTADVFTLALTYGLLDRLDVGALVPYIFIRTTGRANFQVHTTVSGSINGSPNGTILSQTSKFKGGWDVDSSGFGDVILFSKLQILSQAGAIGSQHTPAPIDLAAQLEVKLPTGAESKFLGTGKTDVALRLLAQRSILENIIIRSEIGYNRSGLSNDFNTIEYRLGAEWAPIVPLAFSAEVIGSYSHAFHNVLDGVVGTKYLFPNDFSIFAGLRVPLNENGLRFRYAPIVGVEKTFHHFLQRTDMASLPPREMPEFKPAPAPAAAPAAQAAPIAPWPGAQPQPVAATTKAPGAAAPAPTSADAKPAMPPDYVFTPVQPGQPTQPLPLPAGRNYGNGANEKSGAGGRE